MEINLSSKIPQKYCCELCHYYTNYSKDYKKHLLTKKHISVYGNIKEIEKVLTCQNCKKEFKTNAGLWKHKKNCCKTSEQQEEPLESKEKVNSIDKDEIILMILKQNSEIIKENSELRKEQTDIKELILEIVKNGTINHSNNTTNSHNKAFNLNLFLNETCKNAMNITDFVDSIKLQLSDFMNMSEVGFVEGISNIIVKNLNSLDETVRPIHCTDQKRETFYVKDQNIWEKDDDEKKKMKQMIKSISYKNEKLMKTYKEKYPDYNNPDSNRSDQYSKIMVEAMDCKNESREKIIKNISKATTIKTK
jgi:hypothetical protein